MIADETSGEILISQGRENAYEILFNVDPQEVDSMRWEFEVVEGPAVNFSIGFASRKNECAISESNPNESTVSPFQLVELEMEEKKFLVRDSLHCTSDVGKCEIPREFVKVLIVVKWYVPISEQNMFSSFNHSSIQDSSTPVLKTLLRYKIEILKSEQRKQDSLLYSEWPAESEGASLNHVVNATFGQSGMTLMELDEMDFPNMQFDFDSEGISDSGMMDNIEDEGNLFA